MSRIYQVEKTPIQGTMLLEASAGTGKTYALERMVATLVGRETEPLKIGQILVVTFTNRAAREMRERIRTLLSERVNQESRGEAEKERYRNALGEFDRAPIYTIHGFCQMVLSTWPFESAAPFRQELEPGGLLEREEVKRWLSSPSLRSIDKVLFRAAYNNAGGGGELADSLSEKLLDSSIPEAALVLPTAEELVQLSSLIDETNRGKGRLISALRGLGGADWSDESMAGLLKESGVYSRTKDAKSREAIRSHVSYLLSLVNRNSGNPSESNAVIKTAAAASPSGNTGFASPSFSAGAPSALQPDFQTIVASIFGDPAGLQLKNHFLNVLFVAASWCSGDSDARGHLSSASADLAEKLNDLYLALTPVVELQPAKKMVLNHYERYMQCEFDDIALREIRRRLEKRKDESGRWGYDDLIHRVARKIAEENTRRTTGEASLSGLLRSRYKAALIDEFQDTDPVQWELFYRLFGDKQGKLVLIGDPKQSIYGFRGVGLQAYKAARSVIPAENRYRLDTNYRSRPQLVEATNRFFTGIFRSSSDGSEPVGFEPVLSGKENSQQFLWPNGEVPVEILATGVSEDEDRAEKTADAMAGRIVAEIRAVLDSEEGARWQTSEGNRIPVKASDIAVLVRSRVDEDNILARLKNAGIPAISLRSISVFKQEMAEALVTLLEAFESPRKTALWRKLLLEPFFRIPPGLLDKLERTGRLDEFAERGEYWKTVFEEGRATVALDDFFRFSPVLGSWAKDAGYPKQALRLGESWPRRVLSHSDGERLWQDWQHLVELLQEKQSEGLHDLRRIRKWMLDQADAPETEGGRDSLRLETERPSVRVLTLHSAKGLEFPLVFIHAGYKSSSSGRNGYYRYEDDGRLVVDRIRKNENDGRHQCYEWEEEKRLWYVGFTRASVKLWICRPPHDSPIQIDSLFDDALNPVVAGAGTRSRRLPLHLRMKGRDEKAEAVSKMDSCIEAFVSENPRLFHIDYQLPEQKPPLSEPQMDKPLLAPLPTDSPWERDPRTGSYSSLVRQAVGDAETLHGEIDNDLDRDGESPGPVVTESIVISPDAEALPMPNDRGALYGTLMHAILEDLDFSMARNLSSDEWNSDPDLSAYFEGVARRYYPPDWYKPRAAAMKTLVRNALRAEIPELGRLCDLEEDEVRSEVEFLLAVPRTAKLSLGHLETQLHRGYLKGYIDLLVRHRGLWWVIDWKTNVPPGASSAEDYSPENVQQMMDSHHYHLQYQLYLLSLARTLSANQKKSVDWNTEIGGAAYLFLRGMREEDCRGIFVAKPAAAQMQELAAKMGLEGVIA